MIAPGSMLYTRITTGAQVAVTVTAVGSSGGTRVLLTAAHAFAGDGAGQPVYELGDQGFVQVAASWQIDRARDAAVLTVLDGLETSPMADGMTARPKALPAPVDIDEQTVSCFPGHAGGKVIGRVTSMGALLHVLMPVAAVSGDSGAPLYWVGSGKRWLVGMLRQSLATDWQFTSLMPLPLGMRL